MKITIIGNGFISNYYKSALKSYDVEVYVCDTNPSALSNEVHAFNSPFDPQILDSDLIILSSPPFTHFELLKYFVEENKKVVVEKPAAISVTEFTELKSIYETHKENIYFSYHTVFNPLAMQIRDIFSQSKPNYVSVQYKENVTDYTNTSIVWRFKKDLAGGGCVIDSGINIFSVIYQVLSPLHATEVEMKNRFSEVEDYSVFKLENDNTKVDITMDWYSNTEVREFIFKDSENELELNLANNEVTLNGNLLHLIDKEVTKVDMMSEYKNLVEDFFEYFKSGKTYINFDPLLPLETVFDIYSKSEG